MTIDQWAEMRSAVATDSRREEKLQRKAIKLGIIPHSACNSIALAEAKRQGQSARSRKNKCEKLSKPLGPGGFMMKLLRSFDIPSAWCEGCQSRAAKMDQWEARGCRENRAEIVNWLKEAEVKYARDSAKQVSEDPAQEPTKKQVQRALYCERWRIGWKALRECPWFSLLDPFGSLVDEAIRLAEKAAAMAASAGDDCDCECLCEDSESSPTG